MKYKITLPFPLDGARYGLNFYKGEAITGNKPLAGRLKLRGVKVEEVEDDYTIKSIKGIALGKKKSPGNAVPLDTPIDGDDDAEVKDISDMGIKELKELALDNGIDLTGIPNKKADILNAIKELIDERGE